MKPQLKENLGIFKKININSELDITWNIKKITDEIELLKNALQRIPEDSESYCIKKRKLRNLFYELYKLNEKLDVIKKS